MTPAEAGALLTVAAAFDNRKPDEDAAKAWSVALDGIRFQDARDAIVAHYRVSSEWLMPAKVIAEVKRIRAKRIVDHPPITPPADLSPLETHRWQADLNRRIGDGEQVPDNARGGTHAPTPARPPRTHAQGSLMTWLTTWPADGIPQYAAHRTETAAERHANELVKSRRATVATIFWTDDEEPA